MTVYTIGIVIALLLFTAIGIFAGRQVKNIDDYYVAGRRAPTILIVGSLVASFLSTGAFMGDTGEVYSGFFMGIVVVGILQASGYVYGASLFGRYIRRFQVNTIPEYFGKRFSSVRLRRLSAVTLIVAVSAYLLSAIQGVSTLMAMVTGLNYRTCVIIAWLSFTIFTVYSGSMGVLITDTAMFMIFLLASMIGIPYIVNDAGGWMEAITSLAQSVTRPGIISWTNNLDYLYPTGIQNLVWAIVYGVVWAIVVMVSPWQTSRYLMAKNENVVLRSAVWSSMSVVTVTIVLYFSAAFVYKINPNLSDASTSLIWAAMNCMPTIIGVFMLTGILSAGISSASTFLSLSGASIMNDLVLDRENKSEKKILAASRGGMAVVSVVVLIIAFFNPPQIFWIMYFGGTVIASSWGVVALSSVWYKNLSEAGAFWGMFLGFAGCAVTKMVSAILQITLPLYLDPFFVGSALSILGMYIGSKQKRVTHQDIKMFKNLHVCLEKELNAEEDRKTHKLMYVYMAFGILMGMFFVFAYALPYVRAT